MYASANIIKYSDTKTLLDESHTHINRLYSLPDCSGTDMMRILIMNPVYATATKPTGQSSQVRLNNPDS